MTRACRTGVRCRQRPGMRRRAPRVSPLVVVRPQTPCHRRVPKQPRGRPPARGGRPRVTGVAGGTSQSPRRWPFSASNMWMWPSVDAGDERALRGVALLVGVAVLVDLRGAVDVGVGAELLDDVDDHGDALALGGGGEVLGPHTDGDRLAGG